MIPLRFQGKLFNITVIQIYVPTTNAKEAEVEWFYDDLQDLLEVTPKKDALFITEDWNSKVGSQEIHRVTLSLALEYKMKKGKGKQSFAKRTHSKHHLPTTQEMTLHMDITRWSILKSDRLYSLHSKMETLYTVSKNKTRS